MEQPYCHIFSVSSIASDNVSQPLHYQSTAVTKYSCISQYGATKAASELAYSSFLFIKPLESTGLDKQIHVDFNRSPTTLSYL
jgi:hypothetical protein